MPSGHPEGIVDLGELAGEDHVGSDAAHHGEVCRYGGEAAQDEFVGGVFVIGDDEDVLAGFQPGFRNLPGQAHKAVVQLGVKDYEGVSGSDVLRDRRQEFQLQSVSTGEALNTLADDTAVQ